MKRLKLVVILFALAAMAGAQSTEYLRPTADAYTVGGCAATPGTAQTNSTSMTPLASGTPPADAGVGLSQLSPVSGSTENKTGRVFTNWGTTTNTYSALTVNVNLMCENDTFNGSLTYGTCNARYSTDGGSTWTSLTTSLYNIATPTTYTATLSPSQALSSLQVAVCINARYYYPTGDPTTQTVSLGDIWTNGTISATPAATPSISPGTGTFRTYPAAQTITMSDSTSGATIYYTTNGTAPTTSSTVYTGPFTLRASSEIVAMAAASGYSNSANADAVFTLTMGRATVTLF